MSQGAHLHTLWCKAMLQVEDALGLAYMRPRPMNKGHVVEWADCVAGQAPRHALCRESALRSGGLLHSTLAHNCLAESYMSSKVLWIGLDCHQASRKNTTFT